MTPPPEDPHLQPPPTPEVFRHLKHQFHPDIKVIPMVGRADPSDKDKDKDKDKDRENQTPSNDDNLPTLSLRSPTLRPTLMMLLVDCVSALCVDWNAILPEIAHSTCVGNASRLSLDIHLHTALTNEGLTKLHTEEGNAEESIHNSGGDADFLFVGADPRKVQRFDSPSSVDEQMATGWQPTSDVLTTPMLRSVDEMLDTSYDYDTELYSDGES
ncbi:hypothetical protein Moror_8507 [Moniliophthora roreri MCA 2997]|uniref:Uncharacterized protein n=1 Tax=Moniliophthora roreri (strain MCA 2997) TaxID=1381753 RepID=V2W1V6_MONRO|nr:hypothetical protein Moror_8507 [Moniliophthora roreri MCA 2997]